MFDILLEIFKGVVSLFLYFWWAFVLIFAYLAWQNFRKAKFVTEQSEVVLEIKIPKTNDKTPTAAEMMFATLHGILRPKTELIRNGAIQEHLSFEIVADMTSIRFFVWTPKHLKDFVEGQIYAQYPSAEIKIAEDYAEKIDDGGHFNLKGAELVLTKADFLPIKTFNNFNVDPLAGITGVLSKLEKPGEQIWIQILARPVSDEWKRKGLNWIQSKKGGYTFSVGEDFGKWILKAPFELVAEMFKLLFFGPSDSSSKEKTISAEDEGKISAIETKSEKLGYVVKIRTGFISEDGEGGNEKINAIFGAFKQFNTTNLNGFKGKPVHGGHGFLKDYKNRLFIENGFHLNIEELASIYHMPHTSVETPNINWTTSKTGEPPTTLPTLSNVPENELTPFAETNFRANRQVFGIKRDDRRRHMYVIGKSGMGKTKFLENLINHDIKKGEGVAVIDPHGDLIASTLRKIPEERIKDVIIFDPADQNFPIAYNPMEVLDESLKIQIAAGTLGTFKKIFGQSWGPRLEYVFNYTLLALLDVDGSTLLGVVNMLTDKNFRKEIIAQIKDPVVKKFWTTEWASYSEKFAAEAVAPILNKVGQFTANSLIRNIIGQPKSSFNIRKAMDEGKILLINLSTGRVGETNASLLGSMMITSIQLAAMSRADIAEDDRRDFYLYVDEFQNFATESFGTILSEARKYHLNLTMANQFINQMDEVVRDAVFGNVGTMITFRVGAQDASVLEKEFNPPFESQDLINLARQHIYVRMTIDGQSEPSFSAKTLTVTTDTTGNVEKIIENSRQEYAKPREEVEKEVAKWAGIEIETVKSEVGEKVEVKIKTDDEIVTVSDNEIFEAPLVRRAGKKKNKKDKEALSEIIKENTAKTETASETKNETKENPGEPQIKIKDKIDKETLSAILKNVVTPKEGEDTETKTDAAKEIKENILDKKEGKSNPTPTKINNKLINDEDNEKNNSSNGGEQKEKSGDAEEKENKKEISDSPAFKKEKVITPENFKQIKHIHPHEVVKIVSEPPKDLGEGETIKFE